MFIIVSVQGCLPNLQLEMNEGNEAPMSFETRPQAEVYAKEFCAWDYRIFEWKQ